MIGVDELLTDPDFMAPMARTRTTVTVGSSGVSHGAQSSKAFMGCPIPKGGRAIFNEPGQMVSGDLLVITAEELTPGDNASTGADVVVFQSRDYTVTRVDDYSAWGAGFYAATCELIR